MKIFSKLNKYFNAKTDPISNLEKKINYVFKDKKYLEQAFTHKSLNSSPRGNYERLEFLGDSVLDIIISRELMREFPEGDEGLLTQKRAALVQKPFLQQNLHFIITKEKKLHLAREISQKVKFHFQKR